MTDKAFLKVVDTQVQEKYEKFVTLHDTSVIIMSFDDLARILELSPQHVANVNVSKFYIITHDVFY